MGVITSEEFRHSSTFISDAISNTSQDICYNNYKYGNIGSISGNYDQTIWLETMSETKVDQWQPRYQISYNSQRQHEQGFILNRLLEPHSAANIMKDAINVVSDINIKTGPIWQMAKPYPSHLPIIGSVNKCLYTSLQDTPETVSETKVGQWQLYVLKLQEDKYYVGISIDIKKRMKEHESRLGRGSEWTRKYPIVEKLYHRPLINEFEEDQEVKKLMAEYGIDNVRGGTYSMINIRPEQYNLLQREIWHAKGLCTTCGSSNHFSKNCRKINKTYKRRKNIPHTLSPCSQCGSSNHHASKCLSRAPVRANGDKISPCARCGSMNHKESKWAPCR
jgi:predicted GIY-YIG superfamily endonuclease